MPQRGLLIGGEVLLALVLVAVLAAVLIGRSEEVVAEEQPEREEIGVGSGKVGVGESAEIKGGIYEGSVVTFNDLQRNFAFPNNDPQPRAGYEFVLLNVTVTNPSPDPLLLMLQEDFQVIHTRPYRYNPLAPAKTPEGLPNAISNSWIEPYGEVTGVLYAEVPQDAPEITLLYHPPDDYIVDYSEPPLQQSPQGEL